MRITHSSVNELRRFPVVRCTLPLAILAGLGWSVGCRHQESVGAPPPPAVSVSHPVEREVTDYAEFTARVAAVESTEVRARVSGQIVSVPFQPGTFVRQGDILVEVDVRPFQAELETRIAEEARAAA